MRFTSWITRAANTHAKHVTRTAFPWQQRLRESASTLRLHLQSLSSLTRNMGAKKICTRILVAVNSGLLKQYCSRRTYVHSASKNAPESTQQTWRKTGGHLQPAATATVPAQPAAFCSNKLSNSGNAVCRNNTLHSVKQTRPRRQALCVVGWIYHIVFSFHTSSHQQTQRICYNLRETTRMV
jgi:hypothetical protein